MLEKQKERNHGTKGRRNLPNAWWLDFIYQRRRYQVRLGRNIKRLLAAVKRGEILRGEAGIGNKKKDILSTNPEDIVFTGAVHQNGF